MLENLRYGKKWANIRKFGNIFFWHLKNLSQMSQNMSIEIFKMFLKQHEDIVMHKLCGSLFCTENQKANLTVV